MVQRVGLPVASRLGGLYSTADFADAFVVFVPQEESPGAEKLARHAFASQAR